MDDKKKNIIYFVLIEVVTAVFFLIIGSLLPFIFGVANTRETVIEYVPVEATVTTSISAETQDNHTASSEKNTTVSTTASESDEPPQTIKKINLNTATEDELMTIRGIGETYAKRIVEFRESIGGFTYMEQLKEIEGIGDGRYNAWTPYLTLDD